MIKATLTRMSSTDQGTKGELKIDSLSFKCNTFELPWRNNQPKMSCIPTGTYKATVFFSPHFRRCVYLLDGVPNRSSVEVHVGNYAGDTSKGFRSDVLGCILVGDGYSKGGGQMMLTNSKVTLDRLLEATAKQDMELTII